MYIKTEKEKCEITSKFVHSFENYFKPQNKLALNPQRYKPGKFTEKQLRHPSRAYKLVLYEYVSDSLKDDYVVIEGEDCISEIPDKIKFDFILAEGMDWSRYGNSRELTLINFPALLQSLTSEGVVFIELARINVVDIIDKSSKYKNSLKAIIDLPCIYNESIYDDREYGSCFAVFTRESSNDSILLGHLDSSQNNLERQDSLAKRLVSHINREPVDFQPNDLDFGFLTPKKGFDFVGFNALRVRQQITNLDSVYKHYKQYNLEQLSIEINSINTGEYEDRDNAVYFLKSLISEDPCSKDPIVYSAIETNDPIQEGDQLYIQIILSDKVSIEYLACFFDSKLGQLRLQSTKSGTYNVQNKAKSILPKILIVAVPDIETQNLIIENYKKIEELQKGVNMLREGLVANPIDLRSNKEFNDASSSIHKLTTVEQLREDISSGESKTIEYKETFSLNIHTKQKDSIIELSSLKNICGFLNSNGGRLLIGVSDSQQAIGVEKEIKKLHKGNLDKYLLHFKNNINSHIGIEYSDYINYDILPIDNVNILVVDCLRSPKPCFLDKKDFYVRTNPAADKLEGEEQYAYIKNHFNIT